MSDPNETTYDGLERRHSPMNAVTRRDFEDFKSCVAEYRREAKQERIEMLRAFNARMDKVDDTLTRQNAALDRTDHALYNEDNGLVYMRNWMCKLFKIGCWIGGGIGSALVGIAAIAGSLGWHPFGG